MDQYLNEFYAKFFKRRRVMEGVFGRLKTRFAVVFPFVRTIETFIVHAKAARRFILNFENLPWLAIYFQYFY